MENLNQFNKEIQELALLKQNIHQLRKLFDKINNEIIKKELKNIIKISDNIYKELVINTNKLYKIEHFNSYYIVTVEKVIRKYVQLSNSQINNSQSEEFFSKVETFIKKVSEGFNNLYQSLYTEDVVDIDAEMKVMEKEMKL